MGVPKFLRLEGESLLYNGAEGTEFQFFVPEVFFDNTSKNAIAEIQGQYVTMIGLCNWCIVDKDGKKSPFKLFNFPTMIRCKPDRIEKTKGISMDEFFDTDEEITENEEGTDDESSAESKDFRILHFKPGDEVISDVNVPKIIENVELFYKLAVITAKIPTTVPYDKGWKIFLENMELNSKGYGLNAQLFGIVWAGLCRDPKNIANPFRLTNMTNMYKYKPISIKLIPKYTGIYSSIVSENWDESLRSAILMKDVPEDQLPNSPLEKIIMQ